MSGLHHPLIEPDAATIAEQAWIEVVQRMDEVYSELVASQLTLEAKHRELEENHRFVHGVLSAMSDVLLVCDTQGVVRQVNAALTMLTGRDEAGTVGRALADLAPDGPQRAQVRALLGAGNAGIQELELPLAREGGGEVPVTWNVNALSDADGRYSGFVAIGRPVGELKRAYAELQTAHEALKAAQSQLVQAEKLASLGRLVAGVAHELNNPISFVLGNAHAMARYAAKLERYLGAVHAGAQREDVSALRAALKIDRLLADLPSLTAGLMEGAERSGAIVDALKRFSAIEDNVGQQVDLSQTLRRALHWVSRASRISVGVETRLPDAPVWVSGSANQLQQVLVNLLQNAYDALEDQPDPQLTISLDTSDQHVTLCVADNGTGIAEATLPHIFDPFFTTKPVGKGTGLGLSISYGIVERHRGTLCAHNLATGGACFTLTLPHAG
ncbi:sensor histidine kinase [Crenobacter caeni]|uniref:histidine kinase n=1 Tax=Crenobacter caeni TaxID=2705474 RepID=A0A6B2KVA0_9NEIS|nr:ATP-binding protein [Crenobacter caeni]NDV13970.1 PAS domain-containing protein [Crenobacter caeni]